jgi:hypothetical protein
MQSIAQNGFNRAKLALLATRVLDGKSELQDFF